MASLNKVILIGNIGRDVETKYMPNGDAISNVSLCTTETWKDKTTGDKKEKSEWHNLVFYKKLAEIASKYLHTGMQVYVEGKIETRKWKDKEGNDRYTTQILVNEMKMLSGERSKKKEDDNPPPRQERPRGPVSVADMEDDLPF